MGGSQFPIGNSITQIPDPLRTADNLSKQNKHKPKGTQCSVITNVELKMYAHIFSHVFTCNKKSGSTGVAKASRFFIFNILPWSKVCGSDERNQNQFRVKVLKGQIRTQAQRTKGVRLGIDEN